MSTDRTWTDAEIADRCARYEATGSSHYHAVELTCTVTDATPDHVRLVATRRLVGAYR